MSAPSAIITEDVTPAAPPPAAPVVRVRAQADLRQEVTAASPWGGAFAGIRALPAYIDDLTLAFGVRVYAVMMTDPQVFSSISVLPMATLAKPLTLGPAVPDDHPDKELAAAIVRYGNFNLTRQPVPIETTLYELLEQALVHGHKLAELVYEYGPWEELEGPQLLLKAIKPKPLRAVTTVVDAAYNIAGYLAARPGAPLPVAPLLYSGATDPAFESTDPPPLLPCEKFAHLSWKAQDGNPNGTSHLRACYTAWWDKQQTLQEYLAYKATFAAPGLVMELPAGATEVIIRDAAGTVLERLSAAQDAQQQLEQFRNRGVIVIPNGGKVAPIEVHGEGQAFIQSIKMDDHQITKGILMQSLATDEGEHQARAASQTHQDVLDVLVQFLKGAVLALVRSQILRPLVRYAYGPDIADRLTPTVSLGETAHQDLAALMAAVARLKAAGYFSDDQLPDVDEMLGFPVRTTAPPPQTPPATPDPHADPNADDAAAEDPPPPKGAPADDPPA